MKVYNLKILLFCIFCLLLSSGCFYTMSIVNTEAKPLNKKSFEIGNISIFGCSFALVCSVDVAESSEIAVVVFFEVFFEVFFVVFLVLFFLAMIIRLFFSILNMLPLGGKWYS